MKILIIIIIPINLTKFEGKSNYPREFKCIPATQNRLIDIRFTYYPPLSRIPTIAYLNYSHQNLLFIDNFNIDFSISTKNLVFNHFIICLFKLYDQQKISVNSVSHVCMCVRVSVYLCVHWLYSSGVLIFK